MSKLAIIYTTFLRDKLLSETVQSIQPQLSENCILLIGDQGYPERKGLVYSSSSFIFTYYYPLPFDCGASYARNYLIQRAKELNCDYILMTADSIKFIESYNFQPIIDFMEMDPSIAKVGFNINDRLPWEFNLDLKDSFILSISDEKIIHNSINYAKVDLCRNFFLGKTDAFINVPFDDELKMASHEDHCWRLKLANYKTYYTDYISADYINDKPEEYKIYRNRLKGEFRQKLLKKYNINNWITYSPEVRNLFKQYRLEHPNCI